MSKKKGQNKADEKKPDAPAADETTTTPDAPAEDQDTEEKEHFNGMHKIPEGVRKVDVVKIRKSALPPLVNINTEDYAELIETIQVAGCDVEIQNDENFFIIWTAE